jgi:hypothetical protein
MELDSTSIVSRVLMKGSDKSTASSASTSHHSSGNTPNQNGADLTLSQAFGMARDSFFKGFKGFGGDT